MTLEGFENKKTLTLWQEPPSKMKQVEEILDALLLPREVAIIRDACGRKRNALAYNYVKQASITKVMII